MPTDLREFVFRIGNDGRIARHELWMAEAGLQALRSTCLRGKVGCVIVVDRQSVVRGYNGAPPGQDHCLDVGCDLSFGDEAGCQRIVHAEANAVAHAASLGIQIRNGIVYCTHSPCVKCTQLLASAGIAAIYYHNKYRATPWELLAELGIPCHHYHAGEDA